MRESIHHLTPAQISARERQFRALQLDLQWHCEQDTLYHCLFGRLPHGTVERSIAEEYVAAADRGELTAYYANLDEEVALIRGALEAA